MSRSYIAVLEQRAWAENSALCLLIHRKNLAVERSRLFSVSALEYLASEYLCYPHLAKVTAQIDFVSWLPQFWLGHCLYLQSSVLDRQQQFFW